MLAFVSKRAGAVVAASESSEDMKPFPCTKEKINE
jgi:hypothetical protein